MSSSSSAPRRLRHGIASSSQQSQRYVAADFGYVTPISLGRGRGAERGGKNPSRAAKVHPLYDKFGSHMRNCSELYEAILAGGLPPADARISLPTPTATKL